MKTFNLKIEGDKFGVTVESVSGDNAVVTVNGKTFNVTIERDTTPLTQSTADLSSPATAASKTAHSAFAAQKVKSPLPGLVLGIKVKEGDYVKEGQVVAVIEAMKMQSEYKVNDDCKIKKILVKEGDNIAGNQVLLELCEMPEV